MRKNIRNFCIISHIDHGKSTLADRFLELTETIPKEKIKEQYLDQMDLERERGITIKLQPVRMSWYPPQNLCNNLQKSAFVLNLIDTPGHVDFTYEVSRSLAACEGAILLIDASQGVQAQTLANLNLAQKQNLKIIPVVNKIDLPSTDIKRTKEDFKKLLNCKDDEIILASGKTGQGVEEILKAIIQRISPPLGSEKNPTQVLIFDSFFDTYKGVVAYVRVKEGYLRKGDKIKFLATEAKGEIIDLGYLTPNLLSQEELKCGEIGYVITGLKDIEKVQVGDTITVLGDKTRESKFFLPGYKAPKHFVFASFYPLSSEFSDFKKSLLQLKLNDASLFFEEEVFPSLGPGLRCGFLGLLHLEIVKERLKREFNQQVLVTVPSVSYKVVLKYNKEILIKSPKELPSPEKILHIKEPICLLEVVVPQKYLGKILDFIKGKGGKFKKMDYLDSQTIIFQCEIPLSEVIVDFYDQIKSLSSGFASLHYEILDWRPSDLVKLDILVAGEKIDSFSQIVHKDKAFYKGRKMVSKLKELLPRQLFKVIIQAAIGSKIIAREEIPALRKDVISHLYGGDITRKRKLLEKQKKGKKRMQVFGKIEIPEDLFLKILKD